METSKRIGAAVEDVTRFIQNWFIYTLLFVFIVAFSGYVASITFNSWQYYGWKKWEFGVESNYTNFLNNWESVIQNTVIRDGEEERWREYFEKQYEPTRKQIAEYPEPYKTQYTEQVDQVIQDAIVQTLLQSEVPLPEEFIKRLLICTFCPLLLFGLLTFLLRAPLADFKPFEKDETLHGDAKWATEKHIKDAGLRAKNGLLIGQDNRGYLVASGYQHALLFAPTGSGKGVGFAIPNLLFWDDSLFCHDIKLENFDISSGYRREVMKQDVFLWAPADPDGVTHCYNPIDWVSKKPGQMVDDVQKIANLILPEQEFWNNEARSLFVGVTLYLLAVPDKIKSFGEVVRTLRSDDVVYNLAVVLDTIGKKIHPVSYMNIAAFLQKADKERSGVISTLNSGLELWANPIIDTATSRSDFNIQEMKKRKTTVYVGLTPDNIQRLQPLLQVFYQQATEFLARKIPDPKEEPHGVMFMMDEFPTLGEMKQFHAGIAYFRGYNVRLFLIVQDTQQLKGIYEEHGMNTFLSNSTYRITFAANNVETANLISQLMGNKTVKQQSLNKPKYLDLNPATRTIHESEIQRALLLPQEVIGLPRDEQIILIESTPPIKTKKIFYYKDNFFKRRLLDPIEVPTQEPYDSRKEEEEKKKKEDAEKKKKEEEKKKEEAEKITPPPAPLPEAKEEETPAITEDSSSDSDADSSLPPPPLPPVEEAAEQVADASAGSETIEEPIVEASTEAGSGESATEEKADNNSDDTSFEDEIADIFGDDFFSDGDDNAEEKKDESAPQAEPELPSSDDGLDFPAFPEIEPLDENEDQSSASESDYQGPVPKLDDLPDFPELPDLPDMPSGIDDERDDDLFDGFTKADDSEDKKD